MCTAVFAVKSLTASLWLVRTGRQHDPGEGKKSRDAGQARFDAGQAVHGFSGWRGREQLLSPLMSIRLFSPAFNLQVSSASAKQTAHSCDSLKSPSFQVIPQELCDG